MGFWKFVLGFRFLISDTHPSFGFLIDSPSKIQSPISALLSWWIPLFSSFHFSKLHVPFYINLRDLERVMILVSLSTYLPLRSLCKVWCFLNLHIVWSVACHSALASYELSYFIWWEHLLAQVWDRFSPIHFGLCWFLERKDIHSERVLVC